MLLPISGEAAQRKCCRTEAGLVLPWVGVGTRVFFFVFRRLCDHVSLIKKILRHVGGGSWIHGSALPLSRH